VGILVLEYNFLLGGIWNFLVVDEKPRPADVIIVISGAPGRVEHGVSLFQQGYADKILFSGGGARNMGRQAMSLGVPADHILLETRSYTTFTNAKYSLEVMQDQGLKSAILVTSSFHTRRASIIFHEFFKGLELTVSAAPYDSVNASNWWKNRDAVMFVVSEYLKLVYHYLFER
jgi:uncharacterized SAM-binding protein YcdF (DUF218 family)